ncbi:TetR family transcriptional regulator [Raoultella sp. BIGb0138]|uniref:TetR/AcrR family transcriptional regulator n=1 Tax=Raoultella sp. BIGb0138 TaxID=2485115 RepID=UPI001050677C|nr:TetR/AcrR family transcriptional regulator [Raoultella sp. BIGb0138]TCW15268.1 TetR family transcriptional regulator [Raoultella sp. BIGb0138]
MNNNANSSSVRRGRPRAAGSDERRKAIVEGAYRAFIELGFAQTSTAEVARRAKVSKRTLYEVFDNKMDLFAAVIKKYRPLFLDLPRPDDEVLSLEETLFLIFRLDITEEEAAEREAILKLMTRESVLFPELSDYLYESKTIRSREMLMEWLDKENEKGRIVIDDVGACAGMLMDIVFGALIPRRWIVDTDENGQQKCLAEGRRRQLESIKERIRIVLRGLQSR